MNSSLKREVCTLKEYIHQFIVYKELKQHLGVERGEPREGIDSRFVICPSCNASFLLFHNCAKGLYICFDETTDVEDDLILIKQVRLLKTNISWVLVCREHGNCEHVRQRAGTLAYGGMRHRCMEQTINQINWGLLKKT